MSSVNSEWLLRDKYKTQMLGAPYRSVTELRSDIEWQKRKRYAENEWQQNHRL
jgi:hypothetical protein